MGRKKRIEKIDRLTKEVMKLIEGMEPNTGTWLKAFNKIRRIRLASMGIYREERPEPETLPESTNKQIADRYNAQKAVLDAMVQGEHVNMMDAARFQVCDMHSTMSKVRRYIEKHDLPYEVVSKRMTFGTQGKVCKDYWIVRTDVNN